MTNNMLKYRDFYGSVEYSAVDECFFGKIIGTTDLVTFEGSSVSILKKAFADAVEDYLILCKEAASRKGISLNAFVEKAISAEVYS